MTAFDVRARAQAARMLAPIAQGGKGQVVTIHRTNPGSYNPATGRGTGAKGQQTGSGVEEAYSSHSIDGTLILVGDKKFLLSPFKLDANGLVTVIPIDPPVADQSRIEFADGSKWLVKKCDPLAPAGLAVMFTLQLRGS